MCIRKRFKRNIDAAQCSAGSFLSNVCIRRFIRSRRKCGYSVCLIEEWSSKTVYNLMLSDSLQLFRLKITVPSTQVGRVEALIISQPNYHCINTLLEKLFHNVLSIIHYLHRQTVNPPEYEGVCWSHWFNAPWCFDERSLTHAHITRRLPMETALDLDRNRLTKAY